MESSERKFELYRGDVFLGIITLAPDECDFPWLVGYLESSPEYTDVKALFDQEAELSLATSESDSVDKERIESELLVEISKPGIKMRNMFNGDWIEVNGIHIDGNRVGWR